MTAAEFVYTVVLKPKPLRALANAVICKLIPAQVQVEGATIVLNPRDPVVSGALTFGQYEKPETKFFCAVCKPGMTFLDVGANIGYYTALAIGRIGDGKIVAFEPDPENFTFLEKTAAANHSRDLVCLQKAVGSEKGIATLYASTTNRGDNRLYANDLSDRSVQVEVNTVDAMLGELGIEAADLIKIDIQGFEGQALRGMEGTIRNSKRLTILMEFWPFGLESAGTNPEKFLAWLEQLDLRLFELTENARLIPLLDKANLISRYQGRKYTNIVAFRGDAKVPEGFQA